MVTVGVSKVDSTILFRIVGVHVLHGNWDRPLQDLVPVRCKPLVRVYRRSLPRTGCSECLFKHSECTEDRRLAAVVRPDQNIHPLQRDREICERLEVVEPDRGDWHDKSSVIFSFAHRRAEGFCLSYRSSSWSLRGDSWGSNIWRCASSPSANGSSRTPLFETLESAGSSTRRAGRCVNDHEVLDYQLGTAQHRLQCHDTPTRPDWYHRRSPETGRLPPP